MPDRPSDIRLRPAGPTDRARLEAWDREPHVIAATGAREDGASVGGWDWAHELPRSVPWRELLIAELGRRPIGVVQIIDPAEEESHYWGDCPPNLRAIDIWIGPADCLGRGHGTEMMHQAIARCFAPPAVEAILIDPLTANTGAHRFYERLGFAFLETRRFGEDDCSVYHLTRAAWRARSLPCPKS